MSRFLITTVGTSLLTNRDERPWAPWIRGKNELPAVDVANSWLAAADPVKASAETNTLSGIGMSDADHIRLLHSDTPEGMFCSNRLATWASSVAKSVDEKAVSGLDYSHQSFGRAGNGLKNLIRVAVASVDEAKKQSRVPVFCATGGFKAEIAFLNLFGALLGIEVVYIHEQFRELVVLPCLPITWNAQFVMDNQSFFEWIDSEPRSSIAVENRLNANPQLRTLVSPSDDGNTYLDAAGELLWKAAQLQLNSGPNTTWPNADPRPPSQKFGLSKEEHHRPQGWEAFVHKLCAIDCVSRVSYDSGAHGRSHIKILDAAKGVIGLVYGKENALPLRVETTSKDAAQTELVADYLRKLK